MHGLTKTILHVCAPHPASSGSAPLSPSLSSSASPCSCAHPPLSLLVSHPHSLVPGASLSIVLTHSHFSSFLPIFTHPSLSLSRSLPISLHLSLTLSLFSPVPSFSCKTNLLIPLCFFSLGCALFSSKYTKRYPSWGLQFRNGH